MKRVVGIVIVSLVVVGFAVSAQALPTLQLDIQGGTYQEGATVDDNTILAPGKVFDLYTIFNPGNKTPLNFKSSEFYLSIAVMPKIDTQFDYGSFIVNGNEIKVTSGMEYGTPPIEDFLKNKGKGLINGVSPHGIFDTYYAEQSVVFSAGNKMAAYNTQDVYLTDGDTHAGPESMIDPNGKFYYSLFQFDISQLSEEVNLHFDLYGFNRECYDLKQQLYKIGHWEVAPYSHDASSSHKVPEPASLLLLVSGLFGLGFFAGKRGG